LAQYDVNLREYWRIVTKRKFTVLVIALILGVFSTGFAILKAPIPIYTTVCVIEIKKEPIVEGVYKQTVSWSDSDDIETQITVVKSYAVFEKVAERLGLAPRDESTDNRQQLKTHVIATIENLQSKVEVTRVKYSSILNIKVTDGSPVFAQRLANTVALVYKELHGEQQTKRTREALKYIDDQLRDVRVKLREAEDRFNRFSKENELISIDLQSDNLVARAQEIHKENGKLDEDKAEFENIGERLAQFIRNPVGSGQNFDSMKVGTRYQAANDALVSLLLKRDILLRDFTPKHPEVMTINDEIIETARKMDYLLRLQLRAIEGRKTELHNELGSLDKKTKLMLDKKLEFNRLKREVELYTDMTTLLERKNQEALIKRSEKPEEVNIVKPALLPSSPINPPRTVATGAMGIVIGFIFGLVIAFIVETFDTSLGAIEDVEQTLKTPVLGLIAQVDVKDIQENLREKHPEGIDEHSMKQAVNLIAHFVPKSMMAESFRALRANIQFKNTEKKIKTLAITSASPQEGKTLVSVNLAITMAQAGMKTLLVGADLRKPMVARIFGIESSPGLSDIFLGNFSWRETVKNISDLLVGEISLDEILATPGLDNLSFITAGAVPPNPAKLIESERFDRFIQEAKSEFDMIVFDTAPILSAVDAALIGTKVDGILLLYRVGAVSRGLLKRAMSQLEQVKSQVVGVILNGMRPEVSPDFEDYKHYKYYHYYEEDGKKHRKKKKLFPGLRKKDMGPTPTRLNGGSSQEKRNVLGSSLLLFGGVILGFGLLWHNGIVDPLKLLGAEGMSERDTVKEEGEKKAKSVIERQPLAVSQPIGLEPKRIRRDEKSQTEVVTIRNETRGKPFAEQVSPPKPVNPGVVETAPSFESTAGAGTLDGADKGPELAPTPENNPALKKERLPDLSGSKLEPPAENPSAVTREPSPTESMKAPVEKPSLTHPGTDPMQAKAAKSDTSEGPPYSPSEGGFPLSLQLGSVQYADQAEKGVSQYHRKGVEAYWVEVELSKGIWYRLYAGCFSSQEEAEKFKNEKALDKSIVKELPYALLIASYSSEKDAQEKIESLRGQGHSAYIMENPKGLFRILMGAFGDEARARKLHSQLNAKGIESEIVRR
jgi:succinoglycan biosynthesis transport protein ExoP